MLMIKTIKLNISIVGLSQSSNLGTLMFIEYFQASTNIIEYCRTILDSLQEYSNKKNHTCTNTTK